MTDIEIAYNKALDYLYSFVDYSLKHSSELAKAEFNLDRMFALMEELGNPQAKYPIIHVAGTKGKGSVSALCASALQAAGYKVGLYTSPHLLDYVRADPGQWRADLARVQWSSWWKRSNLPLRRFPNSQRLRSQPRLGFWRLQDKDVNAAVIEVGLGGRLDATNIVTPKVSVITSLIL